MLGIYKFYWDCHYGTLEGIFVEESDKLKQIYGTSIYFGEVLGKHSEVSGIIGIGDITLVTDDVEAVKLFEKYNMETGYNPFHYLDDVGDYE